MNNLYFIAFLFLANLSIAQTIVIKGVVKSVDGDRLPSAHVSIFPDSISTTTNSSGQFSINAKRGEKVIQSTYVGFEIFKQTIFLKRDTAITIVLKQRVNELKEVVVSGDRNFQEEIFGSNRTSTHVLTKDNINAIPVLGGEADVIKTLLLLPGTLRGIEGSSDLFVRGGAADQNLVLLDDVPIHNTSHMFGFLSVFNPDVLDNVEAINGGFPAEYGGRLSSILNVRTNSIIPDRTHVSGDIGLIASRLYIEQPIAKEKASFWLAGRRTYIDQVVKAVGENLPYFFYDFNGKAIFKPTKRDHIQVAHYSGEDILDLFRDRNGDGDGFLTTYRSGNNSQSLQWRSYLPGNFTSTVSLFRSKYKYDIRNTFEENELIALSDIEDYGGRLLLQKDSVGKSGIVKAGIDWTRHRISPNVISTAGTIAELLDGSASTGRVANEWAAHFQYEWLPYQRLIFSSGLRISSAFVQNKNYIYPEPRFSARYSLFENHAIKLSYSRMVQYIHRISNSAITSPTDVWYPVTDGIKPQTANQITLAWQYSLPNQGIFISTEGYYKSMGQLIGYEEGTNLFLNRDFESKLIQGKGKAYGFEFLLRKDMGKLSGWISYTLSWSWRHFNEINSGHWFPSRYDRRHNGAFVMQYAFNKRWAASIVWEFISGSRFTPIVGQYVLFAPTLNGVDLLPVYSGINQVRLSDTHRLDVGVKYRSKPEKKFQWQWFIGVYNAYNRSSPIGIIIEQNEEDNSLRYLQPGLFGLLPFISYGFKL